MSTKYFIADQVRLKLEGGYGKTSSKVQHDDIIAALGQKINQKIKAEYFNVVLPSGETIPDNLYLAEYDNLSVTSVGTRSKCTLPIMPVSLPRNMGVASVFTNSDATVEFIPVQHGMMNMLYAQEDILSDLLGQVGYEVMGNQLIFSRDITIDNINAVNVRLVIVDINQYDIHTPLPIPASIEAEIVEELFVDFSRVLGIPINKKVDNYNPEA